MHTQQQNTMTTAFEVSIVVPLYNEEKGIALLLERVLRLVEMLKPRLSVEVVLVDDGSVDNTPALMADAARQHPCVTAVFLSRNFGHQIAVSSGMAYARGTRAIFIIDGDLQDPPELLPTFLEKLDEGYDVVYGVRRKRKESFLKKQLYHWFYRTQRRLADFEIPLDSGDFSLISRRIADHMLAMPEKSRFLRGMRAWVGFKQIGIAYERDARAAGETKYTFRKLLKLASDGIFNFSAIPLRIILQIGLYAILLSLFYLGFAIIYDSYIEQLPTGFITIVFLLIILNGTILLSLGILGQYIIRIFNQVNNRPLFVVNNIIQDGDVRSLHTDK
jgi:glycosyltransferase involved in cell wall biosynthesis